jgi:D-glycerate 3-kinase
MNSDALNALDQVVAIARRRADGRVPVVGVAGPQGSGKTTLVKAYAGLHPGVAHFSLDDVYLDAAARRALAMKVHPLFATRGPPGTHDLALLRDTLSQLQNADPDTRTHLPAFDKVSDNPVPKAQRPVFAGRPQLILLDGWCIGATAQAARDLEAAVNRLEAEGDLRGHWRGTVNDRLAAEYAAVFELLDTTLYMRAPSFEAVFNWRCEQEEGLLGRGLTLADRERIGRFIAHFERITRHMMTGGRRALVEVQLDLQRNVTEVRRLPG